MAYRDKRDENAWMFSKEPTAEQIETLLKTVPAWHGSDKLPTPVMMDEYMGFVISIRQKISGVEWWRLYVTAAGKLQIMHDAHRQPDGTVIPITEHIELDYKNQFIIIKGELESPIYGTIFEVGTGVLGEGAGGADRTNPVENAMTSWRGRAASALCGAGILPYTGIASAEEVISAEHRSLAEQGFSVVKDTPKSANDDNSTQLRITEKNLENIKRSCSVSDEKLEELMGRYIVSIGESYAGSAKEFVLQQPISFANKMMQYVRENKDV